MIHFTTQKGRFVAVPVPEDAYLFEVENAFVFYELENKLLERSIKLPPCNWQIIGQPKSLTEEQCREIVDSDYFDGIGRMFANYELQRIWTFGKTKHKAIESFHSLCTHYGIKQHYLILKDK